MDSQDQRWALGLTLVFVALGMISAIVVPRGLPYDEPSHFYVLRYHSELRGLPIVQGPGLSYEACQPPLYYFLAGLVYRGVRGIAGPGNAFYACRLATLLVSCPLVYLTYKLAREFSGRRSPARWAAILVAVNPAMLAIVSSIQNDSLSFVFATLASYLCIRWCATRTLSAWRMVLLSLLTAAAIMCKSSALSLIPFIALLVCFADWRRAIGRLTIMGAVLLLTTGWWFVRNHQLYGDWSGGKSVGSVFAATGRFDPFSVHGWVWVGRSLVTYYTTPVTYWRDEVKNPRWFTALIGVGAICVIAGFLLAALRRRLPGCRRPSAICVGSCCVLFVVMSVALWLWISFRDFAVAARVAMPSLAATMFLAGAALDEVRSLAARWMRPIARFALPLLALVFLAADAHLLYKASRLHHRPYEINIAEGLP